MVNTTTLPNCLCWVGAVILVFPSYANSHEQRVKLHMHDPLPESLLLILNIFLASDDMLMNMEMVVSSIGRSDGTHADVGMPECCEEDTAIKCTCGVCKACQSDIHAAISTILR